MKLHIFQSAHGRLSAARRQGQEAGAVRRRHGRRACRSHVRGELAKLRDDGRELEYVYVSHIDSDHISGVLQLLEDEVEWRVFEYQPEHQHPTRRQPSRSRARR